jgi:guanylate kinase
MSDRTPGRLIIISGPSGAGKSTIVRRLLAECPLPLELSVSATTRSPRPGEVDGREYWFLSNQRFAELRDEGAFLECKEVFGLGIWYGTLASAVKQGLDAGKWVILEIDVEGAAAVLARDVSPITIFLHPGGMEELERRLRMRGTELEEVISRRLEVARDEMEALARYDHEVINRHVDATVDEICQLLQAYERANGNTQNNDAPCIGQDCP